MLYITKIHVLDWSELYSQGQNIKTETTILKTKAWKPGPSRKLSTRNYRYKRRTKHNLLTIDTANTYRGRLPAIADESKNTKEHPMPLEVPQSVRLKAYIHRVGSILN